MYGGHATKQSIYKDEEYIYNGHIILVNFKIQLKGTHSYRQQVSPERILKEG